MTKVLALVVAASLVVATASAGYARDGGASGFSHMQVSPEECNGHSAGIRNSSTGGWWIDGGIGSRGGKPHRRMLPQLPRFGMNVAKKYF